MRGLRSRSTTGFDMNESAFARVHAVKEAAQARLLAIPGVHAVGIGPKWVDGKPTTEPAIGVVLVRKRPLAEVPPDEVIPAEIDGVKTDVIEMDVGHDQDIGDDEGDTSRPRPFEGGVKIATGGTLGWGTLGFIARTDEPEPKYVAVTCEHVVVSRSPAEKSTLNVVVPAGSPNPYTFTFAGDNMPGSLVIVSLNDTTLHQPNMAYHLTQPGETRAAIATAVAAAITAISTLPVVATPSGDGLSIFSPGGLVTVTDVSVYSPTALDPAANLRCDVAANVITLSGSASGNYAVYTSWNTDGRAPTGGALAVVPKDTPLETIASFIASSVNTVAAGGAHATAAGAQITIAGAQQAACEIKSDLRVGQPTNSFGSTCSACCNDRIGRVIASRRDIDTALIRLDGGATYLAEIKEYGPVTGTHAITDAEAHTAGTYQVKKRGAMTGARDGTIRLLSMDGYTTTTENNAAVFSRFYQGAMLISPVTTPFSDNGDSGSAVLNTANEVVGLLFGGGSGFGRATPIGAIAAAFDLIVETATAANQVRTAPAWTDTLHFAVMPPVPEQLRAIERDVTAVPAGARFADLVRRHFAEAQRLISTNRRVAAVWHRNGGPRLLQRVLDLVSRPGATVPAEIGGRPLADGLARIASVLERYASPAFAADLRRNGALLAALAGLTYPQAIAVLRTWTVD
jgi:hypothetical protein